MSISKKYEEVCDSIIRPYRETYSVSDLGPDFFQLSEKKFTRRDFPIKNPRGLSVMCSFYTQAVPMILPCVIYMHAHNSSRLEAVPVLPVLLPANINVLTFDFSGCGNSEGEFVSLGWFEKEDLKTIISYLRLQEKVTYIGLWGKGMGAVTALLYADQDPCIAGMVLDSPFLSLQMLAEQELNKRSSLPGFVKSVAYASVRKSIKNKAQFDINDLNSLEHVVHTFVPAIFCRAADDDFISQDHITGLYNAYLGEKKMVSFEGNHNSKRPQYVLDSIAIFFYNCLQCETIQLNEGILDKKEDSDESYEFL